MKNNQTNRQDEALGRYLSLVLRHNPAAAGIHLDEHGWADVEALLAGAAGAGKKISRETLERIVRENSKQRYSFNDDHTRIRANQGHSIPVELDLEPQTPPDVLYHGTALRYLDDIRGKGIERQSRQYVHLSADQKTALAVGSRHGAPLILKIHAKAMAEDGYLFYRSANGVWLCERVPWEYITLA